MIAMAALEKGMRFKGREEYLDKLEVLHKSEHYLAVNKDFDVIMNTNDQPDRLSLCDQVAHRFPEMSNPNLGHGCYVIHRLDFATSGIVLFGVNKKAAAKAMKMFQARRTRKYYLALVHGHVADQLSDINLPIGDDSRPEWLTIKTCTSRHSYCHKPREARTRCVVLERGTYKDKAATKLMLAPQSGRRHQLRVHLQEIGHTIIGDYTYSDRQDSEPYRMFLHALRLQVPTTLEAIDIQTKDPFTEHNPDNHWTVSEKLRDLSSAFLNLDNDELPWTITQL